MNDNGVAIQVQMAKEYKPIDRAFWNSSSSKPYIKHNFSALWFQQPFIERGTRGSVAGKVAC